MADLELIKDSTAPDPGSAKDRGAFFTPPDIARFLTRWAIGQKSTATVLDPTCGEAVFLIEAGKELMRLGASSSDLRSQLFGVDIHSSSLEVSQSRLRELGLNANLLEADFFEVPSPQHISPPIPFLDAIVGNPPFIRYQLHSGATRQRALEASLAQGVRLSGLASSWAPLLIHASSFLKPDGRLAMVLPAELLTVHYAEPIRRWLRNRFASVGLVVFGELQFAEAVENVVLLVAKGSGGCEAFSLYFVGGSDELASLEFFDEQAVKPSPEGKWTDLLLSNPQRRLFREVIDRDFMSLSTLANVELGTVTGANSFFTLTESGRIEHGIDQDYLSKIAPPGTKYLAGLSFTPKSWRLLSDQDERVWLLNPRNKPLSKAFEAYIELGRVNGVDQAYKCRTRTPWWQPPVVDPPDLFFTYMSHRYPRLVTNSAKVTFVNSMHGVRLKPGLPRYLLYALPLLLLNTISLLGAELYGRSYGGGLLKMEPREARTLPTPKLSHLKEAWAALQPHRNRLQRSLQNGSWTNVVAKVDEVLLHDVLGLRQEQIEELVAAARSLRERRLLRNSS